MSWFLTFDIEEWFEITFEDAAIEDRYSKIYRTKQVLPKILDDLEALDYRATFFTLGKFAEKNRSLIREISRRGHQIGCHSFSHKLVNHMNPEEFRKDTVQAQDILVNIIGKGVDGYRAPAFSINSDCYWAYEILIDLGFKFDSSLFTGFHRFGGDTSLDRMQPFIINNHLGKLIEYPIPSKKIWTRKIGYSGDGYFRLLPLFLLKRLILLLTLQKHFKRK